MKIRLLPGILFDAPLDGNCKTFRSNFAEGWIWHLRFERDRIRKKKAALFQDGRLVFRKTPHPNSISVSLIVVNIYEREIHTGARKWNFPRQKQRYANRAHSHTTRTKLIILARAAHLTRNPWVLPKRHLKRAAAAATPRWHLPAWTLRRLPPAIKVLLLAHTHSAVIPCAVFDCGCSSSAQMQPGTSCFAHSESKGENKDWRKADCTREWLHWIREEAPVANKGSTLLSPPETTHLMYVNRELEIYMLLFISAGEDE